MFPKMEMNSSRMPFGPGPTTKPGTTVRRAARKIDLKSLIAHWTFWRMSVLLVVLSAGIVSTATVFAEDLPQGSCQASNSLSVLVRDGDVKAYVPKGAWFWNATGIDVLNIEGKAGAPTQIQTQDAVNSCASNSKTGETVCTENNLPGVYVISDKDKSVKRLTSSAVPWNPSLPPMFFEGNCANCGVTMDTIHNQAVIGLNLSASAPLVEGFQILDLETRKFGTAFPSRSPNQQISPGILIDPTRNQILSPNELGTYEVVQLPNDKKNKTGDDNQDNETKDNDNNNGDHNNANAAAASPTFSENAFTGMPAFGSAGAECGKGIIMGTIMQDPSQVFIARAPATGTAPAGTIQTLTESHLAFGSNGLAMVQGVGIGVLTGELGELDPIFNPPNDRGDWITAISLGKSAGTDGDSSDDNDGKSAAASDNDGTPPKIGDWISCHIPSRFQIGAAPHAVAAYKSPDNGHAMAVVTNWDMVTGVTKAAVIDLTQMLRTVKRTAEGHACALPDQSLSQGGPNPVVRFIDVP